jgi:hypothetical protein
MALAKGVGQQIFIVDKIMQVFWYRGDVIRGALRWRRGRYALTFNGHLKQSSNEALRYGRVG